MGIDIGSTATKVAIVDTAGTLAAWAIYGLGAGTSGADKQISELSCHAKGMNLLLPGTRTVIDIGGQV